MQQSRLTTEQRTELATEAMQAAIDLRFKLGAGLENPVCAYSASERLGVPARFVDISMEGIYSRKPVPRIVLSAQRPIVRRHFNCAHELGHHVFGHSSTIDHLHRTLAEYDDVSPEEFLVDAFAGHFLMPVLGVRQAFSRRGVKPHLATPSQILAVSSEFGVGYDALITQLAFALKDVDHIRRHYLAKARPALRISLVGGLKGAGIALLDEDFVASTLDIEEDYLVVAPGGAQCSNDCARLVSGDSRSIFKICRPGIVEIFLPGTSWTVSVRVARERFVGLARYRYLEDGE
jgi:Zn-dependent peptidase ImmA (M78 family)